MRTLSTRLYTPELLILKFVCRAKFLAWKTMVEHRCVTLKVSLSLLRHILQVQLFPRPLKFVRLWRELLLHAAQLLDQGCEGDSLLRLLVPAPAHHLINLPTRKTWKGCSNRSFSLFCVCILKKGLLTDSGQPSGRGSRLPSFNSFTRCMTVIWPCVLPIMSMKHCTSRTDLSHCQGTTRTWQ